jgi:hypothetical protein
MDPRIREDDGKDAPLPNPSPACGRGTKGWILRCAQNDKVNDTEGIIEGKLTYGLNEIKNHLKNCKK